MIYIQAKRWENNVAPAEIQKFVGALHGKKTRKGVFITTSSFYKNAWEYASNVGTNVILIDGNQLTIINLESRREGSLTGLVLTRAFFLIVCRPRLLI